MKNKQDFKLFDADKLSKNIQKITFVLLIIIVAIGIVFCGIMSTSLMPVDPDNTSEIEFVVEDGWGSSTAAEKLADANLIRNKNMVKLYLKFVDYDIKKGTYTLSQSMSVDEIFAKISSNDSLENQGVTLTLVEGKRYIEYMETISQVSGLNYDEILSYTTSSEYLNTLIEKYWFITDEILNDKIYYPLEGYIYPDTYSIPKNATIDEIMDIILSELGAKLEPYKTDIENGTHSVHSLLTLASVIELEAVTEEDRKEVSGVFYNRINLGMTLGSDVTTYYGSRKSIGESLTISDLTSCNGYNTREASCVSGLPVGPICSPSLTSIKASIYPNETEYIYFVADKNNKLYFAKTYAEHTKIVQELKDANLWLE